MSTTAKLPPETLLDSPLHHRRSWGDLDGLGLSLKESGQAEDIIARSVDAGIEIVDGHRRKRAAIAQGIELVDVEVRVMSDAEVLAHMLATEQRESMHPLDEAELFAAWRALGASVQEVADKVGRPKAYVYSRIQLAALVPEAKALFERGTWTVGAAVVVARLTPEQQTAALAVLPVSLGEPLSQAAAARIIRARVALRLAIAPFDLGAKALVEGVGPCTTCTKNTGVQRALFSDDLFGEEDPICLDRACFGAKRDADWEAKAGAAKSSGQKVLTAEQAKALYPLASSAPAGHVEATSKVEGDPKGRTVAVLMRETKARPSLVRHPHTYEIVELYSAKDVAKVVASALPKKPPTSAASASAKVEKHDTDDTDDEDARRQALVGAMVAKVEAMPSIGPGLLLRIVKGCYSLFGGDLEERRGWGSRNAFLDAVEKMKPAQLWGLIFETSLDYSDDEALAEMAGYLGAKTTPAPEKKAPAKGKSPLTDAEEKALAKDAAKGTKKPAAPAKPPTKTADPKLVPWMKKAPKKGEKPADPKPAAKGSKK